MKRIWALVTKKQMTVGSAAAVLALMVLLSRVLGLVRDRLLATFFAPEALGIYFAAFRIPNFIFELLVMGALTSAFIPVYSKYLAQNNSDEAQRVASGLINLSLIFFLVLAVPLFIGAPWICRIIAPGFNEVQITQMAAFTRFMVFFQVIPLLIGNVFTGILQSHNLFLIPALAPVLYNVGIIIGVLAFAGTFGLWAPVYGVGIGALLFVAIHVPALFAVGYRHTGEIDPKRPGIREVGKLMGPRTFGLAVTQIDTTVDLMMSSLLGARMVTIFNFAQQLQQLPIGLFGQTIAQAALPSLSMLSAREEHAAFVTTVRSAIHQIMFLVLPDDILDAAQKAINEAANAVSNSAVTDPNAHTPANTQDQKPEPQTSSGPSEPAPEPMTPPAPPAVTTATSPPSEQSGTPEKPVITPNEASPGVPAPVKAEEKKPEETPNAPIPDASSLVDNLLKPDKSSIVVPPPPSKPKPLPRKKSIPGVVIGIVALLLLALPVGVYYISQQNQQIADIRNLANGPPAPYTTAPPGTTCKSVTEPGGACTCNNNQECCPYYIENECCSDWTTSPPTGCHWYQTGSGNNCHAASCGGGGPTATPTTGTNTCLNLRILDTPDGNQLTPSALQPGQKVYLAVHGTGTPAKAHFRINGDQINSTQSGWTESTTKNSKGEFVAPWTVDSAIQFQIDAEVYINGAWD